MTQGLTRKYQVLRHDGRDGAGQRHEGCEYFVLDLTHDSAARAVAMDYAALTANTELLNDLIKRSQEQFGVIVEEAQSDGAGIVEPIETDEFHQGPDITGATFMVGTTAFHCIDIIGTHTPLFECNRCTAVVTDPDRHLGRAPCGDDIEGMRELCRAAAAFLQAGHGKILDLTESDGRLNELVRRWAR